MTWQVANRIASIAATQAHGDLEIDSRSLPIQVSDAINGADVTLMWQQMPALFGVYIRGCGDRPGILVNSKMTRSARRHTAAHELGHHRLGHASSYESGSNIGSSCDPHQRSRAWSPSEQAAEAFASWFLMPRLGVIALLNDLEIPRLSNASQVYQLSLHMGTAYASTVRHLQSLRLISRQNSQDWARISPSILKRKIDGDLLGSTRDVDVWHLGRGASRTLHTSPLDLIYVPSASSDIRLEGGLRFEVEDANHTFVRCDESDEVEYGRIITDRATTGIVIECRPQGLFIPRNNTKEENDDYVG